MACIAVHHETEKTFKERPGIAILLTAIANKILEKERKIKTVKESLLTQINEWERQLELLVDFENRHKDELVNICPEYLEPKRSHEVLPFLFGPINHLECLISGCVQLLETPENFHHELNNLCRFPEGFSEQITMDELAEITGLSLKSTKSLLAEMDRRGLISKQRSLGPCSYKINDPIYLERARNLL
jgi:hypothetical protein